MTQVCSICIHRHRFEIEKEIVSGCNLRQLAKEYDLDYQSLYYHSVNHVSRSIAKAMEKKELTHSMDLLARIESILQRADDIFTRNYKANKDDLALKALSEQRNTISLLNNIAAQLTHAKQLEYEMAKDKFKDSEQEVERMYGEGLACLNQRELKIFQKLITKIRNKSDEIILPDR
jgi:hypothetical protein